MPRYGICVFFNLKKSLTMQVTELVLALVVLSGTFAAVSRAGLATNGNPINTGSQEKYTLAIIGDMPYGEVKTAAFPQFIDFMNEDPKVDLVAHLGDIKSGSTRC